MSLFYKEEHVTCYNYKLSTTVNFNILHFQKCDVSQAINVDRSVLLFMISGEALVTCSGYKDKRHKEGEIALVPRNSCCLVKVIKDTTIISCSFVQNIDFCNRFSFHKLVDFIPDNFVYDFTILPIRERISEFLHLLQHCLDDQLECLHFHELMERELFIFFRVYYTKEELAAFFYPLIGKDIDFKDFVLSNYLKISGLNEFASQSNMSLNTFKRRFQDAFGQSAHKWIIARKAEWIYKDILLTDKPFSEIGQEYGFRSPTYFSEFCKKYFGKSPQLLREKGI